MKKPSRFDQDTRATEIEALYRTAGTPITRKQATGLAGRERAEDAAAALKDHRLGDFLPENAKPAS
jgi:hypothetical protein